MISMIETIDLVAGLGWDPEIRGLLTVALGMAVLGGSVWLLLVTNTGTRLGSLIALAGFWGWMFVMGIFWWIYGIGWAGSLPSWEIENQFNDPAGQEIAGIQDAFEGNVNLIPDSNCFPSDSTAGGALDSFPPASVSDISFDETSNQWALCTPRAVDLLMAYPDAERNLLAGELINAQNDASKLPQIAIDFYGFTAPALSDDGAPICPGLGAAPEGTALCDGASPLTLLEMLEAQSASERDAMFDEMVARRIGEIEQATFDANETLGTGDPRYKSGAALQADADEAVTNALLRIDDMSLSQLQALAPQVSEWATEEGLLRLNGWNLQSTSQSGEAAATADAFLREELFPDGNFLVLDAFQQGGKDKRDGDGMWTRITHKIGSTLQIQHPPNYTVVNVQQTLDKVADPSKPPPVPEIDPEADVISVVMIRNLGNLRLVPGLFTIVSLILFLLTSLVLHWRDLAMREKGLDV